MTEVDINFGINMVEIVTKGLYTNALDTLREYIQNSCDAIDDAIGAGTLNEGDGEITIDLDAANRRITIKDNGIGISSSPKGFVRVMSNFGNSDKSLKTDRGFRGIGQLGGLAYCKTLIFSTKVAGEKKFSTLTINAEKIRQEFFSGNKRSAEEVLSRNMIFDTADVDTDEHFFKVELIDIVIRLRLGNIQIGNETIFQTLFKETRDTNYFIDEVHAVDKKLRPTSRRDDFEEDKAYKILKEKLKEYFKELHKMYHVASDIRNAFNAINAPEKVASEFQSKSIGYRKSHQAKHNIELVKLKKLAATAEKKILSARRTAEQNPDDSLSLVVLRMTENKTVNNPPPGQPSPPLSEPKQFPPVHWSRDKRKLYNAIEEIIIDNPKLAGKVLLEKIKEELAK